MTTTREVERKYDAPEGAATPQWAALAALGQLVGVADETLEATYFDTADLRLLGAGLTLRRRTGGHDAGWHLKLPAGTDARDEIQLPLTDSPTPPAELVALTRSRTRGARLVPVATLTTARRRRQWTGPDGALRVELVDDRVTAHSPGNGHNRAWRELEVELGPDADPGLLDVVEQALLDAGARRSASPNKLSRALGGDAPEPAPRRKADRTGRKDTVADAVLAYVAEQAATVVRLDPAVRQDAPDAVHAMRVATRRTRSALQAFGRVIERDATRALTDELKWLAGVLGAARDLEVLQARVEAQVARLPEEQVLGPVRARVVRYFAPREAEARAAVVAALDGDRYLELLDAIDRLLADPPLTREASQRAAKALPTYVERAHRRVEGHLRAAEGARSRGADPDVELHEARKKAKRVRYAAEAATPALGEAARRVVKRAVEFQDLLGEHQDAVVARPVLRQIGLDAQAAEENAFTWGVLYAAGAEAPDAADLARTARRLRTAVAHLG